MFRVIQIGGIIAAPVIIASPFLFKKDRSGECMNEKEMPALSLAFTREQVEQYRALDHRINYHDLRIAQWKNPAGF
jgi:hypothetical protein